VFPAHSVSCVDKCDINPLEHLGLALFMFLRGTLFMFCAENFDFDSM
jgi:hypothetical protein